MTKKAVLITGCDTGFGNLLAKRLANEGVTVFAACLTQNVNYFMNFKTLKNHFTVGNRAIKNIEKH